MGTAAESRQVPLEVRTGAVLAGRYRVDRVLAWGGMGVVVAAQHVHLGEPVALKFLLPEIEQDPDAKSRFAREAWTTAKIKNEHVVRVLDVGELPSGSLFLVMEYLEGKDLASVRETQGRLPITQAVQFLLQACEGIAEAHALGIVHRDLKPSNFFCVRRSDGELSIKILDFGMSKLTRRTGLGISHSITSPSLIVGSPLYMSPEQMNSAKDVDARADIWSLGVILYELLSGVCPFVAEMFPELAVKIAIEAPPSLRDQREEIPKGLERIVLRCLEKDRNKRYADVAQLAHELADYAPARSRVHAERAARALRPEPPAALPEVARARPSSPQSSAPPAARSRRALRTRGWLLVAGVPLVGLATFLGGALVPPAAEPAPALVKPIAAAQPALTAVAPGLPPPSAAAELAPTPGIAAPESTPVAPAVNAKTLAPKKPAKRIGPQPLRSLPAPTPLPLPPEAPTRAADPARAELDELGGRH